MSTVVFKATFLPSRPRRASRPEQLPTGATGTPASTNGPKQDENATRRPSSRAARMLALAYLIERQVESGAIASYSEAARSLGVTRARMTQLMNLLSLPVDLQEKILMGRLHATERSLRLRLRDLKRRSQELEVSSRHQR